MIYKLIELKLSVRADGMLSQFYEGNFLFSVKSNLYWLEQNRIDSKWNRNIILYRNCKLEQMIGYKTKRKFKLLHSMHL